MQTALNERVQQLIDELVESGQEVGLQVAVYHNNELVVDAWTGIADEATKRPVTGDTLFTSWSTTKGFAATCLHILADRGRVSYDDTIATYWPEFAAQGKEAATVRHALIHAIGVPHMPSGVTPEMLTDWDAMCAAIAAEAPLWVPGTKVGYHAWTFGWIIGELVRRIDGRPIAQFAREELCEPLGIADFYLGIPDAVEERVAQLRQGPPAADIPPPTDLTLQAMPPDLTSADVINRPDVRRASIPGAGGIMNARAIARHYAMLAGHGVVDGTRILSSERVDEIRALQTDARDEVFSAPNRKGLGYMLGGKLEEGGTISMGSTGSEFGHGGLGGSMGFADADRDLSFGLTKTLMAFPSDPSQSTAYKVAEAVRAVAGH